MSNSLSPKSYKIGIDARLWHETGVGRYIRNLVSQLEKIDTKNEYVLFVLPKDVKAVQATLTNSHFQVKEADVRWHTVAEQRDFPKILENEQLDLVHFSYFSVPVRYNGKFVLTIHDLILHHFPTGKASTRSWLVYKLKHLAYKYIISQAAKKAEKIIAVSHATEKEIVEDLQVPQQKITVTYEGFDVRIKNHESRISDLPEKYFLYVGNAYPHKNLEKLVAAFRLFNNANPDIKLILVGKEDFFYKRLKMLILRLGLEDAVLLYHNVTDGQLATLYSNALSLVMPSLMEGFGLPVVEAMAMGCLVALSDIPVFREIAQDSGVYFNPSHVQDIQNVLESIAKGNVPHETHKKQKGKEIAKTFSWKTMADKTHKVYQSCLGI